MTEFLKDRTSGGVTDIPLVDILKVDACGNYVDVTYWSRNEGRMVHKLVWTSMKQVISELPTLLKTHRSRAVVKHLITGLHRAGHDYWVTWEPSQDPASATQTDLLSRRWYWDLKRETAD